MAKTIKRNKILSILLLFSVLFSGMTQILLEIEVYAENNLGRSNIGVFEGKLPTIKSEEDLKEVFGLIESLELDIDRLGQELSDNKPVTSTEDGTLLNKYLAYQVATIQQEFLKSILHARLKDGNTIKLDTLIGKKVELTKEEVDLIITSNISHLQSVNRHGEFYYKEYETCISGAASCEYTTEGIKPIIYNNNAFDFVSDSRLIDDNSELKDKEKEQVEELLDPIVALILATNDISDVIGKDVDGVKDWVTKNNDLVAERLNMLQIIAELYNAFKMKTQKVTGAAGIQSIILDTTKKMMELSESAGVPYVSQLGEGMVGAEESKELEEEVGVDEGDLLVDEDTSPIIDLIDVENQDLSEVYKSLIAWTASFTPFKTNLGDELTHHLGEDEKEIYNQFNQHRQPIYVAHGEDGVARGIAMDAPTEIEMMSLGEFLDNVNNKEMLMFLKVPEEKVKTEGDEVEVKSLKFGKDEFEEDYSVKLNEKEESGAISNKKTSLLGPIYASSGPAFKDIYTLNIASENDELYGKDLSLMENDNFLLGNSQLYSKDKFSKLKGNTMNMNYMLMHNTLEDGEHLKDVIKRDLAYPMYADFLGNIVSRSGIIIVPAAANYTYYNYSNRLPAFNAMFLNSYPKLKKDTKGDFRDTPLPEKNKFVYQKNKSGGIEIGSLKDGGADIAFEFQTLPLWSEIPIPGGGKIVDFMNDLTSYVPRSKGYNLLGDKGDSEGNYVFTNNGVRIKDVGSKYLKYNNLGFIPNNPKSIEWSLMKDLNYIFMAKADDKMLDSYIMSGIADIVITSPQEEMIDLKEYVSRAERFKLTNKTITLLGEIFENLMSRSIFEGNAMGGTSILKSKIFGRNSSAFTSALILVTLISFILIFFNVAKAMAVGGLSEVKPLLSSLVLLILVTVISLNYTNTILDLIFNKPVDLLTKDQNYLVLLAQGEAVGKTNNYLFSEELNEDGIDRGDSNITLARLTKEDIEEIRGESPEGQKLNDFLYLPEYDNSKVKVIGDKVYLSGKDLKINTSDLFQAVRVSETDTDGKMTNRLTVNIEELGEISYYMPYFNIVESLTDTVNSFSSISENSYELKTYSNGVNRTTGRTDEYFNSLAFFAPEDVEEIFAQRLIEMEESLHLGELSIKEHPEEIFNSYIKDLENMGIFIDTEIDEDMQIEIEGDGELEDGDEAKPNIPKVNALGELVERAGKRTKGLELNRKAEELLTDDLIISQDWLGIRKVLLMEEDFDLFPIDRHSVIKESRWFPREHYAEGYTKELDRKIMEVNDRTKAFVLNEIIPISSNVSDETLIKVISLYATIVFNEVFSTQERLYPRYVDITEVPDEVIVKILNIPVEMSFKHENLTATEHIINSGGVIGLIFAILDRLFYFLRKITKETLIVVSIILAPFFLIYVYTRPGNERKNFIKGLGMTVGALIVVNLVEVLTSMMIFKTINAGAGNLVHYFLIIIRILLTLATVTLFRLWIKDPLQSGYGGYTGKLSEIYAGAIGLDYERALGYQSYNSYDYYEDELMDFEWTPSEMVFDSEYDDPAGDYGEDF